MQKEPSYIHFTFVEGYFISSYFLYFKVRFDEVIGLRLDLLYRGVLLRSVCLVLGLGVGEDEWGKVRLETDREWSLCSTLDPFLNCRSPGAPLAPLLAPITHLRVCFTRYTPHLSYKPRICTTVWKVHFKYHLYLSWKHNSLFKVSVAVFTVRTAHFRCWQTVL